MDFDINSVTADMLAAIKGKTESKWDIIKGTTLQFLERDKSRLELIALLRLNGDLTPEKFESRLSDHRLIMEAELNAVMVLSKATAQSAANAAIDVLEKAVVLALKK